MAKKSKKSKKLRKIKQSKLLNMTDPQRIEIAKKKLAEKNARDAISILKKCTNINDDPMVRGLLFQSYMKREEQLTAKGMSVEAAAILDQAFEYLPDFSVISEDHLCLYLEKISLPMAVDAYFSYTKKQKAFKQGQQIVANRICQTGQWKLLDIFGEDDALAKDRTIMIDVQKLMAAGEWEKAYAAIKPLSRTSPYVEFKLFCRGICAFYCEDDAGMLQAFNRISKNFPLYATINELKLIASPVETLKKKGYAISKIDYLWDGAVNLDRQIGQLMKAADNGRSKEIHSLIQSISKSLYPKKPEWATFHIINLLLARQMMQRESIYNILAAAKVLLTPSNYKIMKTKFKYTRESAPFLNAARYLDCLPAEIPDTKSQKLAKAMILFHTAKQWLERKDELSSIGLKYFSKELNLTYADNEELLIALVCKGLSFDPLNRSGYDLLIQLPRSGRTAKNEVEKYLLIMLEKMENDPVPCLELATLYYEKNAFRKAETVLEEAMKRAPHDNRVIERHVISLMISADINFNRDKMHLAERDIAKACQIECKSIIPYLVERQILYDLWKKPSKLTEIADKYTAPLNIAEAIRALSLLYLEGNKLRAKKDNKIFNEMLGSMQKQMTTLTGSEILYIFAPIPKAVQHLYKCPPIVSLYDKQMPEIFKCLNDSEAIAVFNIILSPKSVKIILKEIKRRLGIAEPNRALLLKFYQVTIWHLEDRKHNPNLFEEIVEQAKGHVLDEIRALSKNLAKHAGGSLKRALESLDFTIMDSPFPFFMDQEKAQQFDNVFDDGQDEFKINKKNLHDDEIDEYIDDNYDDYDEDDDDFFFDDMPPPSFMDSLFDSNSPMIVSALLEKTLDAIEHLPSSTTKGMDVAIEQFEALLDSIGLRDIPETAIPHAASLLAELPGVKQTTRRLALLVKKKRYQRISKKTRLFMEAI